MVIEALQTYAQMASGLTKTTREKALATAKSLLDQAGLGEVAADAGDRVSKLADELLATSKANRQLLTKFVDSEVKKAVGKLGLAKAEDVESLRAEIAALRTATAAAAPTSAAVPPTAAPESVAQRPAKKAPARKAPATKASAANVAPNPPAALAEPTKRPAKKASAKTAAAKAPAAAAQPTQAPANKAAAKKAVTKKASAKQAATEPAETGSEGAS